MDLIWLLLIVFSGIAQVHRATLRAEYAADGQSARVAVKVQILKRD